MSTYTVLHWRHHFAWWALLWMLRNLVLLLFQATNIVSLRLNPYVFNFFLWTVRWWLLQHHVPNNSSSLVTIYIIYYLKCYTWLLLFIVRSVLQWDRRSQNKHCQNCYNEITFGDWSTRLFQQSPLYDLRLTRSSKTRSVISLLAEVPSIDHLNLSYKVQRSEIGRPTTLYFGNVSIEF